jgi:hypothetical protein
MRIEMFVLWPQEPEPACAMGPSSPGLEIRTEMLVFPQPDSAPIVPRTSEIGAEPIGSSSEGVVSRAWGDSPVPSLGLSQRFEMQIGPEIRGGIRTGFADGSREIG